MVLGILKSSGTTQAENLTKNTPGGVMSQNDKISILVNLYIWKYLIAKENDCSYEIAYAKKQKEVTLCVNGLAKTWCVLKSTKLITHLHWFFLQTENPSPV